MNIRRLAFTSLFLFYLMIINIIFVETSLYVMVLQVGKICVFRLTRACIRYAAYWNFSLLI